MFGADVGEIVVIASIVLAVGIFVGSKLWMVFRKNDLKNYAVAYILSKICLS